jgi:hypothetical protein
MVALIGITTYLFSKKALNNKVHSFINGLIVITSLYVIAIVIEAPWDIFTHGFMLVAIYHLFQLFEKQNNYFKHTLFAGLFIGLSILCKGPISIYALLLPFLISYGIIYRFNDIKSKGFSFFSVVIIGLVVGGWWYLYVRMEDPSTFLQMTKTETSNWSSYNIRPFYYYWSFFVQSGIWTIPALISLLYPFLKSRVSHIKVYKFSLIWTILAVILLSIIPEKKTRYLMPVLIPLAINTGFYIEYLIRTFKDLNEKKVTIPVHLSFGLIALIGILFPLIGFFFGPTLTGLVLLWYLLATLLLGTIGVLMIINLKRKVFKNVFYLSIGFFICAFISVIPMSGIERSSNYNSVSSLNEQNEQNRLKVYSLTSISPEYIWHYGSKISSIKKKDSTYDLPVENTFGLLTRTKDQTIDNYLSKIYEIKYSETFDLNNAELDTKNHRNRLRYHYYILSKK